MITADRLREILNYDPESGMFTWRDREDAAMWWKTRYAGKQAGRMDSKGHRQITIDGRAHLAHRLAWLYAHGSWPIEQIDHINGHRDDNRLSNLREASHAENARNRGINKGSRLRIKGVTWNKSKQKFVAQIGCNGKKLSLGHFDNPQDASEAYRAAAQRMHGEFARS